MSYSDTQPRGILHYRLLSASPGLRPSSSPLADLGTWGHEYVSHCCRTWRRAHGSRTSCPAFSPSPRVQKVRPTIKGLVSFKYGWLEALVKLAWYPTRMAVAAMVNDDSNGQGSLTIKAVSEAAASFSSQRVFQREAKYFWFCEII